MNARLYGEAALDRLHDLREGRAAGVPVIEMAEHFGITAAMVYFILKHGASSR